MIHDLKKTKNTAHQHNIFTGGLGILCTAVHSLYTFKLQHPSNTPFSIWFEHAQISNITDLLMMESALNMAAWLGFDYCPV